MKSTKSHLSPARIAVVSGLLVSGILLWLALKDIDFGEVAAAFRGARFAYVIPALAALGLFYWLKAVRWRDLLAPSTSSTVSAHALLPSVMVGVAGNNILPLHLGELVRVYLASRDFPIPKATLLVTLVLERLLDAFSVLALLVVVLLAGGAGSELHLTVLFLTGVALVGLACGATFLIFRSQCIELAKKLVQRLPAKAATFLTLQIGHALQGLSVLHLGHMYARLVLNSLLQWTLMAGCVLCALLAFDISVPFYTSFYVLGLIIAGLALPTSPGFIGTIQFCFLLGLRPFDVAPSLGFSASVFFHVIVWLPPTLWGAWYAQNYRLKWGKVKAAIAADPS